VKTPPGSWSLTGFAAAGLVSCVAVAAGTAPANGARFAANCNPSDGVGSAWQVTYKGKINTTSLNLAVLKPGDELSTDDSGSVDFCLALGGTRWRIASSSVVKVAPGEGVLFSVTKAKGVSCHSTVGKPLQVKVGRAEIQFRPPSRKTSGVGTATGDAHYSIKFGDDGRVHTDLKLRGGVTACVVGRDGNGCATVRTLWGTGHGAFRTKGRYAAATVRG
jgi:hypothetical protein